MTLTDIERMLSVAKVPRSKIVKVERRELDKSSQWKQPEYIIHVPATSYMVIANVVGNLKLNTSNVKVTMLESKEVSDSQHVLFSTSVDISRYKPDPDCSDKRNAERRRALNRNVVIDCVAVTLQ